MLTCSKCGKFIAHPDAVHTCEAMTLPTPTPLTDAELARYQEFAEKALTVGVTEDEHLFILDCEGGGRMLATITSLQSDLQRTRDVLAEALDSFDLTQGRSKYPDYHWSVKARAMGVLTPPTVT
jgi:hypothetical protein